MKPKFIRGQVEINYGMDNRCFIHTRNGRRVNLTEWMKKLDGKKVHIDVFLVNSEQEEENV